MRPGRKLLRIPELDFKKIWEELGEEPPSKISDGGRKKKRQEKRATSKPRTT